MASKRSTPLDDPPSASSDDEETEDDPEEEEEDEDESESEEEEDEEDQQQQSKPQNPLETPKIQNPSSKPAESSSEEESESESEEQTPPRLETPIIETSKTLTPKSSTVFDFETDSDVKSPTASGFAIKPSKKANVVGEKTPASKRLFTVSDVKEKKKMKVSNGDSVVDDEKKSVVKRVWSDDDELLLLEGFIDYQSKKGCSPLSDMEGFYRFTMDSLPGNASKSQLYEKIRRLKKKFRVNSEKMSENGEDPVFQKPHERKLFEVSKKIWGIDGCETVGALNANVKSNVKSRAKTKPKVEVKEEEEEDDDDQEVDGKVVTKIEGFETLYPFLSAGLKSDVSSSLNFPSGVVHLIKDKLSLIGEAKAKELNEKWKAYFDNETVLRKRRIALLSNVAELGASVGK